MKYYYYILIFIILFKVNYSFAYSSLTKEKSESITLSIKQIHEWCSSNHLCAEIYHQTSNQVNFTIFRFLIERVRIEQMDYLTDLNNSFGNFFEMKKEEQIRELWILKLLANRQRFQTICDIHHKLIFDPVTLISSCECLEDQNCDNTSDLIFFYVIIGLGFGIALIMLFQNFWRIALQNEQLNKITKINKKINSSTNQKPIDIRKEIYGTFIGSLL